MREGRGGRGEGEGREKGGEGEEREGEGRERRGEGEEREGEGEGRGGKGRERGGEGEGEEREGEGEEREGEGRERRGEGRERGGKGRGGGRVWRRMRLSAGVVTRHLSVQYHVPVHIRRQPQTDQVSVRGTHSYRRWLQSAYHSRQQPSRGEPTHTSENYFTYQPELGSWRIKLTDNVNLPGISLA